MASQVPETSEKKCIFRAQYQAWLKGLLAERLADKFDARKQLNCSLESLQRDHDWFIDRLHIRISNRYCQAHAIDTEVSDTRSLANKTMIALQTTCLCLKQATPQTGPSVTAWHWMANL